MAKIIISHNGIPGSSPEFDAGTSGATKTINWFNGNAQKLTLTANCAITFTGPLTLGSGYATQTGGASYVLRIVQDSTPRSVTFTQATYIQWGFLGEPDLTNLASGEQIVINFLYDMDSDATGTYVSGYSP